MRHLRERTRVAAPFFVLLLLTTAWLSSPARIFAASAQNVPIADWYYMNANQQGTNFVSQNQLNEGNVPDLQLKWTFPFPSATSVPGLNITGQGVISPPLVVNGTVFLVTNFLRVYAINAETGTELWQYDPQLNTTGLPLGPLAGHMHGINFYRGDIWVSFPDCSVHALDAATGALVMMISRICAGVPGNQGFYDSSGVPPVFYGNTLVWTSSVSEGTDVGRGFVAAYDLTTQKLLWRWYVTPPAGGDPNWDADQCVPPQCQGNITPVNGDWGVLGHGNRTLAGAGPSFGEPTVDERRGIVYVSTSQASPDWNGTFRPGPDLYSDSIVALNATSGQMIWYFQTTPHDLYDFDCGWNTVLGNVTLDGSSQPAIFKACKNGYVYALNAETGKRLWYFNPPSLVRNLTGNANYVATGSYSGNESWINYPSTQQFRQCPGENGGIESDIAFAYGKLYVATHNFCTFGQIGDVTSSGSSVWGIKYLQPDWQHANTTIYSIEANTGKAVWSYFIPSVPYRGWLTVSGGMVFASSLDGNIHILDANSGQEVSRQYLGPSLYEGVTLGSTATGDVYLYQLVSSTSYGAFSQGTPGMLMAFAPAQSGGPNFLLQFYFALGAAAVLAAVVTVLSLELRSKSHSQRRP